MATPTRTNAQKTGSSFFFYFFPHSVTNCPVERHHIRRVKFFSLPRNSSDFVPFVAILSVYNKTGLLDLAKGLTQQGIRLLASGGTASLIRDAGMPVK